MLQLTHCACEHCQCAVLCRHKLRSKILKGQKMFTNCCTKQKLLQMEDWHCEQMRAMMTLGTMMMKKSKVTRWMLMTKKEKWIKYEHVSAIFVLACTLRFVDVHCKDFVHSCCYSLTGRWLCTGTYIIRTILIISHQRTPDLTFAMLHQPCDQFCTRTVRFWARPCCFAQLHASCCGTRGASYGWSLLWSLLIRRP